MINKIANSAGFRRLFIIVLLSLLLFFLRDLINLILFTFIFSFLMEKLVSIIFKRFTFKRRIVVVTLYIAVVGILVFASVRYVPLIVNQITILLKQLTDFYASDPDYPIVNYVFDKIGTKQISGYMEQGFTFLVKYFTTVSKVSLQILLALLLSFFFLLEKPRLIKFTNKFKDSKISAFYNEIHFFGHKFASTFGKVIEAQIIIALVNCVLTTIALWILGFPQLGGLSIMILLLGLIPVAGVIISLIPLSIIAFSIGGFIKVLYIAIAVMIVHAIEAYILNPKLMSSKTNLPVFYTFVVLIISEHFFGIWGLIIGIPLFVFALDVLDVNEKD